MTDTDRNTEEITLVRHEYDYEKKCGMCGYRTVVQWNLGEDECEELSACGSCTTQFLADNTGPYSYRILRTTSEFNDEPESEP